MILCHRGADDAVAHFSTIMRDHSCYTANVIAHHGVLEPGVHFVQKPFSINDLALKVKETIHDDVSPG